MKHYGAVDDPKDITTKEYRFVFFLPVLEFIPVTQKRP